MQARRSSGCRMQRSLTALACLAALLAAPAPAQQPEVALVPRVGLEGGSLQSRTVLGLTVDVGLSVRSSRFEYRASLGVLGHSTARALLAGPTSDVEGLLGGASLGVEVRWWPTQRYGLGLGARGGAVTMGERVATSACTGGSCWYRETPRAEYTFPSTLSFARLELVPAILRLGPSFEVELYAALSLTQPLYGPESVGMEPVPVTGGVRVSWPLSPPFVASAPSPPPGRRPPLFVSLSGAGGSRQADPMLSTSLSVGVEYRWARGTVRALPTLGMWWFYGGARVVGFPHVGYGHELLLDLHPRVAVGFGFSGGFGVRVVVVRDEAWRPEPVQAVSSLFVRASAIPLAVALDAGRRTELALVFTTHAHLDDPGLATTAGLRFGVRL